VEYTNLAYIIMLYKINTPETIFLNNFDYLYAKYKIFQMFFSNCYFMKFAILPQKH